MKSTSSKVMVLGVLITFISVVISRTIEYNKLIIYCIPILLIGISIMVTAILMANKGK